MKRNKHKKILVLHGGFDAGDLALSQAIDLAKKTKAKITVLHIVNIPTYPMEFASTKSERENIQKQLKSTASQMKERMEKEFYKKLKKYRKTDDIKILLELRMGPTLEKIVEYQKKKDFDVVIMAKSKGSRSAGERSVIGGLTIKLLERLRIPILIVDVPITGKYTTSS